MPAFDDNKYITFPGWNSPVPNASISDDGYYIGGELKGKVIMFSTQKAARNAAKSIGHAVSDVTKVHTRFFAGWAVCDGRFGFVRADWYKNHPNHIPTQEERLQA